MKKCFKCGQTKELECFYRFKEMMDGHLNKCITCAKKDAIENRQKNIHRYRAYDKKRAKSPKRKENLRVARAKYIKKHPFRRRQNRKLERAAKNGKIIRPNGCEVCGKVCRIEGHHRNYFEALEVMWVCQSCHKQLHKVQKIEG